ncbi:MAG: prepilin peptidase [candidate division WOR-3 bacterium]
MHHHYPVAWYWYPIIFLIGVTVGWFLNVVIHRYSKNESLLYLPYCPGCKRSLSLKENIPIIGYFLAQGRCSTCDYIIPIRQPIIEILTGLIIFYLFYLFKFQREFYNASLFFIGLILIGFIDLEAEKIPFPLTISGIIIGLGFNFWRRNYISPLLGFFFGWGIIYLIYYIGLKTEKREVVGNQEMFLAGMIGSFIGMRSLIIALFLGTIFAVIYGVKVKKSEIPFGPFLTIGGGIAYFYAGHIIRLICPFFSIIP